MSQYLYLILALCFLAASAIAYLLRPDLRPSIRILALFGLLWGPLSEHWFFQDYWRPEAISKDAWLEDCLYGAGISVAGAHIYKVFARRRAVGGIAQNARRRLLIVPAFIVVYVVASELVTVATDVNSIYAAMTVYVLFALFICIKRKDLVTPALYSAMLMGLVAAIGYGIGLNYIVDGREVLDTIWLLYEEPGGFLVLGVVPLSEILWYAAWGLLLGTVVEYITGKTLVAHTGTNDGSISVGRRSVE